jgi:hypothetical protein
MDETLRHLGQIVVNNVGDVLNVNAARGEVGRNQYTVPSLLESGQRRVSLGLRAVRADAAFAKLEIYKALERRGVKYVIRIPANENLERDVAELLPRPVGRPSHKPTVWYKGFL